MESYSRMKVEKYPDPRPPPSDDEEDDYEYLSSGSDSDDMFTENSMAALLHYLRCNKQYHEDWDESETDTPEEELSNEHNMSCCKEQSDEDWDMCELDTPVDPIISTEQNLSNVHNMSCCTEQSDEDWDKCEPDTSVNPITPTEQNLSNVHNMSCCTEQSDEDWDKCEPDRPVDPIISTEQELYNVPANNIKNRCASPFLAEEYGCLPSEIEDYKAENSKEVCSCSENDEDTDDGISEIPEPLTKKRYNVVKNNNIISSKKPRIIPRHLDTYYFDSSDSDEDMFTVNSSREFMGYVCKFGTRTDD